MVHSFMLYVVFRKRMVRKHYDLGADDNPVDPGPVVSGDSVNAVYQLEGLDN